MKRSLKLVTILVVAVAALLAAAGCQSAATQPAPAQPKATEAPAAAQPAAAQPAAQQPAATQAPAKPAAAAFPTKPIDLIVPNAPGGGTGVTSETLNKIIVDGKLSPQPFVISYRPGASGQIGAALVSARKGDGHALFPGGGSVVVMNVLGQSPLDPLKDFTPLALSALDYSVVITSSSSPYKSFQDVINALKKSPKSVTMGGTGSGSWDGLLSILIESDAKVKFNNIPFNGGSEVNAAVLGGQVDLATGNLPEMEPLVAAGKLRPLAVVGEKRMPAFKDVPTLKELGVNVTMGMPRGWFGPPGLSPEVTKWYGDLFKKVGESPMWVDYANKNMMDNKYLGPDDFAKLVTDYKAQMTTAFKAAGAIK